MMDKLRTYIYISLIALLATACTSQTNVQVVITPEGVLHNGIELPNEWPPVHQELSENITMPVPYLENRPEVITIDVGRQLFVDTFLIESTNLKTVYHTPNIKKQPIIQPNKQWELNSKDDPYAAPFSGGVWYDELDKIFKMWYSAGGQGVSDNNDALVTCYATSPDGINWKKSPIGLLPNKNIIDTTFQDCNTIWLDKHETDLSKRYKMFSVEMYAPGKARMLLKYSDDGISWSEPLAYSNDIYDRCSAFYNPFIGKYILSLKALTTLRRSRNYVQNNDPVALVKAAQMKPNDQVHFWFSSWDTEERNPDFPELRPEIYNMDAIPYESIILGQFVVWKGPENNICDQLGIQKRNEIALGYSRDGFHWSRPNMTPFIGVKPNSDTWQEGNIQSSMGSPLIVGDSLYFYFSGRKNNPQWDSNFATGLATLRRDGFVSMATEDNGYLLTQALRFSGKYLFVNANIKQQGSLQVEIIDENGRVIDGFSKEESKIIKTNGTKIAVTWKGNSNLAKLSQRNLRFKFHINSGELYSFWVSQWKTGESYGITSGGGPGLHPSGIDIQ